MNKHRLGFAVVIGMAIALAAPQFSFAAPAQQVQKLFQEKCSRCHGQDGSADSAIAHALGVADLRSAAVQKLTDAQIYTQIDKGKGNMPPFGSDLSKPEINELVSYVRTFGKQQTAHKTSKKR